MRLTKTAAPVLVGALIACLAVAAEAQTQAAIRNEHLTVRIRTQDGAYEILPRGLDRPVLISGVGAEVNHQWVLSAQYPHHKTTESSFEDALGSGKALTVVFTGLANRPDLVCIVRVYDNEPYGDVSVKVQNVTSQGITVHAIRDVDALGMPRIDLGSEQADRVLAEIVSENPSAHIGALAEAPNGDYLGVRDDLVYNTASKRSLLLAALTEDRFLTVSHLRVTRGASGTANISSFTMDSTGTTKLILDRSQIPPGQQVELSLPVAAGASLSSELVMFTAGPGYLQQLESYGSAVRRLNHLHFSNREAPMGWWSWTAFYSGINAGEAMTNARWLAQHLKPLGYDYFHIDEGYEHARGEYTTRNTKQFPDGMWILEHRICNLGLAPGIWTAPFEVSSRSWIYQHHQDWLVHDAHGKPIFIGYAEDNRDRLYVLDSTNPFAQAYLRQTYHILTREWGIRYIKLDFMDNTAIEGYYYKPHTTALEAQRIGLKIIREAVGSDVLLDKDGSVMLAPVGFVNEGRVAPDTGHSFSASKDAVVNIANRFYMNRNFFVTDPDAFSVSREVEPQQHWHESHSGLTLKQAQVQIVLAALAGGMYELGDDLPTLGSEPRRLALVENRELIDMNRLGKAAMPLDLMTFPREDEDPSVFFLREDRRQSMLAVFNWTGHPRSHTFTLAGLHLPASHPFQAFDVLNHDAPVQLQGDTLRLENQAPESVRLIKLVDTSVPAAGPSVAASVPTQAHAGEPLTFSANAEPSGVPAIGCRWDFGDGTSADGCSLSHTYTLARKFTVHLTVQGVEGLDTEKTYSITATGFPNTVIQLHSSPRL